MANKLPQLYELQFHTEQGDPSGMPVFVRPLDGVDREVQFMGISEEHGTGAHNYAVRIVQPDELKKIINAERRRRFIEDCIQRTGAADGLELYFGMQTLRSEVRV